MSGASFRMQVFDNCPLFAQSPMGIANMPVSLDKPHSDQSSRRISEIHSGS